MNNNIYPCLWMDGTAKEAAEHYCTIFEEAKILSTNPMVTMFSLFGKKIMALNGGPMYKITPAVSFSIHCSHEEEIKEYWNALSTDGFEMMPLDKYDWAEKYGWVKDKFGMTWQLFFRPETNQDQKLNCSLLLTDGNFGKAKTALDYYCTIFPSSAIEIEDTGTASDGSGMQFLRFGQANISGETISAMDGEGAHKINFTEGLSLVVECETQKEIDHYWLALSAGGSEGRCGWLKDQFGVSWQIVPTILGRLMSDPQKQEAVMQVVMKSTKFVITDLEEAEKK